MGAYGNTSGYGSTYGNNAHGVSGLGPSGSASAAVGAGSPSGVSAGSPSGVSAGPSSGQGASSGNSGGGQSNGPSNAQSTLSTLADAYGMYNSVDSALDGNFAPGVGYLAGHIDGLPAGAPQALSAITAAVQAASNSPEGKGLTSAVAAGVPGAVSALSSFLGMNAPSAAVASVIANAVAGDVKGESRDTTMANMGVNAVNTLPGLAFGPLGAILNSAAKGLTGWSLGEGVLGKTSPAMGINVGGLFGMAPTFNAYQIGDQTMYDVTNARDNDANVGAFSPTGTFTKGIDIGSYMRAMDALNSEEQSEVADAPRSYDAYGRSFDAAPAFSVYGEAPPSFMDSTTSLMNDLGATQTYDVSGDPGYDFGLGASYSDLAGVDPGYDFGLGPSYADLANIGDVSSIDFSNPGFSSDGGGYGGYDGYGGDDGSSGDSNGSPGGDSGGGW